MKDDSGSIPMAVTNAADTMPECDTITPSTAMNGPLIHGEDDGVALLKRHYRRPRLHPRPLLDQDEFTAGKITQRIRKKYGDLERKYVFSIKVLVETVIVVFPVSKAEAGSASLVRLGDTARSEKRPIRLVHSSRWSKEPRTHFPVPQVHVRYLSIESSSAVA